MHRTHVSTILIVYLSIVPHFAFRKCTQTFTPLTVGSSPYPGSNVNSAVQGGTTSTVLCFASGSYGEIDIYAAHPTGGTGQLTIQPSPGATVTGPYFNLNGVSKVHITGFCDTELPSCPTSDGSNTGGLLIQVGGHGNNDSITYDYNSMSSNGVQVRNNAVANAAILIDRNSFVGFTTSNESSRLNIVSDNSCPNGITVSNNIISGGESDGMNTSGNSCGTQFLNNDISNINEVNCNGIHCDGFQDNGGGVNTVLNGNYWHNVDNCFQITDGTTNITITNNVCVLSVAGAHSGQLAGTGVTFKHNTWIAPGKVTNIGNTSGGQSSSFTELDNVFVGGELSLNGGQTIGGTGWTNDYNLCDSGCVGSHSLNGSPTLVGGGSPSTYAGFALAARSLGLNAGDDGKDMGINVTAASSAPTPRSSLASIVH